MSTVSHPATQSPPQTLAELVERLGDIPLERIRVQPPPGTATEEDVVKTKLCELVDGCLVDKDIVIESHDCDGPPVTLAQLVHRLGDIPLKRIRMQPAPGTATEADVVKTKLCELVDGVIVEKGMGYPESRLGLLLGRILDEFAERHGLGFVVGADALTRLQSGLLREPDVSFVRWDRVPSGEVADDPIGKVSPNLAVEIVSPSNSPAEMDRKKNEYFESDVQLVWIVNPRSETVTVWTTKDDSTELSRDDSLDGGDVLPGFSMKIGDLFERARRRQRPESPRPNHET